VVQNVTVRVSTSHRFAEEKCPLRFFRVKCPRGFWGDVGEERFFTGEMLGGTVCGELTGICVRVPRKDYKILHVTGTIQAAHTERERQRGRQTEIERDLS